MRERLIELVDKAKKEYASDVTDYTETDYIVECLLNEGVIVPPCKVGDTLYHISTCITAENFEKNYIDFGKVKKIAISKYGECISLDTGYLCSLDCVGKTVSLTRGEAEQALKGGAE